MFNLTHKVSQVRHLKLEIHLKKCYPWHYTEMDQTKYRVSSMFAFGCIIWTLLHLFTCT